MDLRAYLVAVGVPYAQAATALAAPPVAADGAPQPAVSNGGSRALRLGRGDAAAPGAAGPGSASGAAGATPASNANSTWLRSNVDDFLFGEMILSEGAPYTCAAPDAPDTQLWCSMRDVRRLKQLLLGARLLAREHGPQQVLRGQEAVLRQRLAGQVRDATDAAAPDGGAGRVAAPGTPTASAGVAAQDDRQQRQEQQQPAAQAAASTAPPAGGSSIPFPAAAPGPGALGGTARGAAAPAGVGAPTVELPIETGGALLASKDTTILAAT